MVSYQNVPYQVPGACLKREKSIHVETLFVVLFRICIAFPCVASCLPYPQH